MELQAIKEKDIKLFSDKEFNKELLKYAVPIALQQLMLSMVSVADTLMLGRLDQNCMSAVALAAQIQFIQNLIVSAAVATIAILVAQYMGKKDMRSVDDVFLIGIKISGLVSLITFFICLLIPESVMSIYTDEPLLIEIGSGYLRIACWSYLITGISQCFICMIKVSDKVKWAAIITGATVLINIVFNAILIFGLFGFPAMAEKGAATATLIARIVELVWCVILVYMPGSLRPSLKGFFKVNWELAKDFITQFIPIAAAYLLWSCGISAYAAFMGHLGLDAVAAYSMGATIREMMCFFCYGIAQGGAIIIGKHLGDGDLINGKIAGIRVYKWGFLASAIVFVIMLILTPIVVATANMTEQARQYLLGVMLILSVYSIGRTYNTVVIDGVFKSGGDTKFDPISLFFCMWCLAVPLAALGTFVFNWSPLLVCAMICLDEVGKIPLTIRHYKKYKWLRDLTR